MKWLKLLFILGLFCIAPTAFAACGDSITGGSGTVGAPYLISTPAELAAISNCLGSGNSGKYFKLDADIDLNVDPYNTGTGWTRIGTGSGVSSFYGKFDGDFHTISNLYFNSSATSNVGLFGYVSSGGTISNVLLSNAVVSGNLGVGALVGTNYGAISKAGVVDGSVTGIQRTGGLVGSNNGSMTQTYSDNTVYFNPTSSATCCVGGLTGESYSGGSINNSYSRSPIIMTYNAYNQGAAGGLYGNDYNSSTKTILYSTGSITMVSGSLPASVGGLGGSNYTTTSSSYWDTQTSGLGTSGGGAGVVGKTTSQMKDQSTYSGWDFSTIWTIDGVNNDGYPYLLWQDFADVTAPTITNVSSDKTNGSYTVGEVIDIDVTFSETVTSTGNVTVTLETGATDQTCTFTVTSSTTGTCNYTVQAGDTSADLTVSSISGTIADASANAMSNFVPTTNLATNKALVIDTTAPTMSTLSPADGATGVSATANLVLTFDTAVDVETGNITIKKSSDDSTIETIDVTGGLVTGTGTTMITINPTADFDYATGYYVQIDATAFDDTSSNSYAGIADTTTWNFTTESEPVVVEETRNPTTSTSAAAIAAALARKNIVTPTISPTPAPTMTTITRMLKTLIRGDDVRTLQRFLNGKGFILATQGPGSPGNETDLFGGLTRNAVMRFQAAHGLEPDGIVGPVTRAKIMGFNGYVVFDN